MAEHISVDAFATMAIDAYQEYRRIVGDDDGGTLFTPDQYEEYKRKVVPTRMKNRLFVCYTNPQGMDCMLIGPETECFCQHRYKQHQTDFEHIPEQRNLKCKVARCRCACFHFKAKNCGQAVRCHCKHDSDNHTEVAPYICKQKNCKCVGYKSSFTCDCGYPHHQHHMVIETKQERMARGHPVGQDVPYQAMGGLTGFSSLAAGYARLDPSGQGAPSEAFLNQPITAEDHPFLRGNVQAIKQHKLAVNDRQGALVDQEEQKSQMRQPGESELDFYERRYQEKNKRRLGGGGGPKRLPAPADPVTRGTRQQHPPPPPGGAQGRIGGRRS